VLVRQCDARHEDAHRRHVVGNAAGGGSISATVLNPEHARLNSVALAVASPAKPNPAGDAVSQAADPTARPHPQSPARLRQHSWSCHVPLWLNRHIAAASARLGPPTTKLLLLLRAFGQQDKVRALNAYQPPCGSFLLGRRLARALAGRLVAAGARLVLDLTPTLAARGAATSLAHRSFLSYDHDPAQAHPRRRPGIPFAAELTRPFHRRAKPR
jgi:hypothetical protein